MRGADAPKGDALFDHEFVTLPRTDEQWIHNDWFPRAIEAGWRYWAVVPPIKFLGEKNMRRYAAKYRALGLGARLFEETETTMRWLEQQR